MYENVTKAELNDSIAAIIGDEGKIYRTNDEIDLLIKEAMLTFGAISGYWKSKIQIGTTNNTSLVPTALYDLEENSDFGPQMLYQDIINWLDIDLLGHEDLINDDELLKLITNAINIFQSETKLVTKVTAYGINIDQPIIVDNDVLDILAAYYIDSSNIYHTLQLADENRIALFNNDYIITRNKPRYYSISNSSLKIIDLFPRPIEGGFLQIVYVTGKDHDTVTSSNVGCVIPDNLTPYLKYKVEYDIFNKDNNKDPFRAAYCLSRWNEGLIVGKNYSAITNIKLNNVNKPLSSIIDFNNLRHGWRNDVETLNKKVNAVANAGYNLIALNRIPINTHSLLFETIVAAPYNDEFIDLRPDYISALIDYILHISSIKDGIASIQSYKYKLEEFLRIVVSHNNYLETRRISYVDLLGTNKYPLKQAKIAPQENAV